MNAEPLSACAEEAPAYGECMTVKTREEKQYSGLGEPGSELSAPLFASAWVLLLTLLLVYYFPTLSGKADFYLSDNSHFFEPLCRFVGEQLRAGQFPLWNPLLYCGMSQAAIPSPSLFYFPSYFVFLLPYSQGLSLYLIFHHLLMSVGSYFYLRHLKLARASALFGALSAGLMSYFFTLSRNFTLPAVVAWLPISLYLQSQIKLERSKTQMAIRLAFALAVSMFVYAGRPELFLVCLAIVIANAAYAVATHNCARNRAADMDSKPVSKNEKKPEQDEAVVKTGNTKMRYALALAVPLIAAVLLAAPAIIPALEWSALSPRAHGQKLDDVFSWSASFYDFLAMLLSFPAGDVCDLAWSGSIKRALYTGVQSLIPFLSSCYLGPIIFTLACGAFCDKEWRLRRWILLSLLAGVVICAGQYTPFLPALLKLFPALSVLRYPVKLLVFPAILLILAASKGVELLFNKSFKPGVLKFSLGLAALCLLLALSIYTMPAFALVGSQLMSQELYANTVRQINVELAKSLLHCSLVGMAFCAASYFYLRGKIAFNLFAGMLIAGTAINAAASAASFPFIVQADYFNKSSKLFSHIVRLVKEDEVNGCQWRILPLYPDSGMRLPAAYNPSMGMTARFHSYARSLGYYNMSMDFGVAQSYGYEAAATGAYWAWYKEALEYSSQFLTGQHPKEISDLPIYRFCRLTGTKYLLTQESLLPDGSPLPLMDERYIELFGKSASNNSRIYRINYPLPRVYFAQDVKLIKDWSAFTKEQLNPSATPADSLAVTSAYLLESELPGRENELNLAAGEITGAVSNLMSENAGRLEISAKTAHPSLLVLSDQYYPGWLAEIDGKRVPILRANLFARAVVVPAGEHKLLMRYEPLSVKAGIITALASLLILAFLAILI